MEREGKGWMKISQVHSDKKINWSLKLRFEVFPSARYGITKLLQDTHHSTCHIFPTKLLNILVKTRIEQSMLSRKCAQTRWTRYEVQIQEMPVVFTTLLTMLSLLLTSFGIKFSGFSRRVGARSLSVGVGFSNYDSGGSKISRNPCEGLSEEDRILEFHKIVF